MSRRKRSGSSENITYASDRVDHGLVAVYLGPQPVNEHIHYVGLGVEGIIEDVLKDHRFGHRASGVAHKVFEQRELTRLQFDRVTAPSDLPREEIQSQVPHREASRFRTLRGAANQGLDSSQELRKRERFGDVIIST